jgi:hypothetical protein
LSILKENDGILAWSRDRKSLLVRAGGWQPAVDLERVELATGRRTLVKRLAPSDPGTLVIQSIVVADDAKSYAYGVKIHRSALFLVNGAQ